MGLPKEVKNQFQQGANQVESEIQGAMKNAARGKVMALVTKGVRTPKGWLGLGAVAGLFYFWKKFFKKEF